MLELKTRIHVLERQIAIIEDDPKNTTGGSKAFFSGDKTYLKDAAIAKIAKLKAKLETLYSKLPDADE